MQIDYNDSIKERFIPIPYDEILSGVLKHFETQEPDSFHLLAHKIHLHYYHHYYATLQELRGLYRCFNPDRDTITNHHDDAQSSNERESKLYGHIAPLLNDANYERLTKEILEETMNRTSPYGVEVSVDFDDFEQIELYFRGESIQMDEIRDPKTLYLKKKQIQEPLYRRLFLIIKPKLLEKRAQEIAQSTGKDIDKVRIKLQKNNPLLITDEANRNIYIKLFKNIPHADLEMLFPNTKVRMTLFDKIKLAVLGGGGTIGGGSTLVTKLGAAALDPIAALGAIGAFMGILWRQVKEVFFRRTHYMAKLSERLYFHNLDNNEGALNYMVNMAVQEESKEALFVYLFLTHQQEAITLKELDHAIEAYVRQYYDMELDFEVTDGVNGVRDLGLLIEDGDKISVLEVSQAIDKIQLEG